MITRVAITNFHSFREKTVLDECRSMNVLVGPNNAGKSNVCSALSWFFAHFEAQRSSAAPGSKGNVAPTEAFSRDRYLRTGGSGAVTVEATIRFSASFPGFGDTTGLLATATCGIAVGNRQLGGISLGALTNGGTRELLRYDPESGNYEPPGGTPQEQSIRDEAMRAVRATAGSAGRPKLLEAVRRIGLPAAGTATAPVTSHAAELAAVLARDTDECLARFEKLNEFVSTILQERVELALGRSPVDGKPEQSIGVVFAERTTGPKTMPLTSLGSGVQDVVLLAIELAVIDTQLFLIEEPESHLHPDWQRALVTYLDNLVDEGRQFFLTTHSAALLDAARALGPKRCAVYSLSQKSHASLVRRCNDDELVQLQVLDDLGYRASDLLQANAVIWVEGPSDCVYLRRWLDLYEEAESVDPTTRLEEGRHFVFAMFGGTILARHTAQPDLTLIDRAEFLISRVNANIILLVDQDHPDCNWNAHKERMREEVQARQGLFIMTHQSTIEGYVPDQVWKDAGFPNGKDASSYTANKYAGAKKVVEKFGAADLGDDLREILRTIVSELRKWNWPKDRPGTKP